MLFLRLYLYGFTPFDWDKTIDLGLLSAGFLLSYKRRFAPIKTDQLLFYRSELFNISCYSMGYFPVDVYDMWSWRSLRTLFPIASKGPVKLA